MKNMNMVVIKGDFKWRLVQKYGKWMLQGADVGHSWGNWFFAISEEPKPHWIYCPEFGVWRCNISAF